MADEEVGGAERMEVSTDLPPTPQRLACVSPSDKFFLSSLPPASGRSLLLREASALGEALGEDGRGLFMIDLEGRHRIKVGRHPHFLPADSPAWHDFAIYKS